MSYLRAWSRVLLIFVGLFSLACLTQAQPLMLGIDVLERQGFAELSGKRVGLLTHPPGVNRYGTPTVDVLLRTPRVELVALFGPEHGIYGDEEASVPVDDKIDTRTGLPVYSLYGKFRKPTSKMLAGLDALVIDLQDIGVRSYTFISCMRLAMEACFENNVEVVVLDRPNPLGGLKVGGPSMDADLRSYVGTFQIPYVHGLTIGEIAKISKDRIGWLDLSDSIRGAGKLTVIPMQGWRRRMLWTDTGLTFIPTSPNIPDVSAVLGYAMAGLGTEIGDFSHGIGTPYPFRLLRFKGKEPQDVQAAMIRASIPGLSFPIVETKTSRGAPISGVYIRVDDYQALDPVQISFEMMRITARWQPRAFKDAPQVRVGGFNKHVGSMSWWNEIKANGRAADVEGFLAQWKQASQEFQNWTQRYWLYAP